ncbi:MAG: hypothetical protein H6Q82_453 [Deltaproteobacteria bacterium]|nr:hypothetical protein [Deltaproteobacteria bacterium]
MISDRQSTASACCSGAIFPASWLIWNLRLDQFRQKGKRLLPAKIASLGRNDIGERPIA